METTIKDYEEMVKGPGKFGGEQRYIPYYWEMYLAGFADGDDGRVLSFRVTREDKGIFPELKRRKVIRLCQRDDGFVVEY